MLVPCVKTGEGLSKEEIAEIEAFVQKHALERFGPVRTVSPALVFEITFDAVYPSTRRKSGVVLTAARVRRWWRDKKPEEADHLEGLHALVPSHNWEFLP
jgi:DNA ligase-1